MPKVCYCAKRMEDAGSLGPRVFLCGQLNENETACDPSEGVWCLL